MKRRYILLIFTMLNFSMAAVSIDSQVSPKVCNSQDKTVLNPTNYNFWPELTKCGEKTLGDAEKTTSCLLDVYPHFSHSCASCFGTMTACVTKHCMFSCMFGHASDSCKRCALQNCMSNIAKDGFDLFLCTGLNTHEIPQKD